jgi:predicted nuclease of predicted toxin-antitoxin system
MNFLVDAQLPRRMADWLAAAGCDAIHTQDLPDANRTADERINDVALSQQRVVITKDADFVDSHLLHGRPPKLLLISTGNISNRELEALMAPLVPDIVYELASHSFLELGRAGIVVRGD